MKTAADTLIDRYTKELQRELRGFPSERRREILDEVSGHISEARSELESENEASIRTLLDRLGEPSEIAAAARERLGLGRHRAGVLEAVGAVALAVPILGTIGGIILVWMSRVWTRRDKVIATILVPGLWLLVLVSTVATSSSSGVVAHRGGGQVEIAPPLEPSAAEKAFNLIAGWLFPLGVIVLPVAVAIYLLVRARNISDAAGG